MGREELEGEGAVSRMGGMLDFVFMSGTAGVGPVGRIGRTGGTALVPDCMNSAMAACRYVLRASTNCFCIINLKGRRAVSTPLIAAVQTS